MGLPSTIKVLGKTWQIVEVPEINDAFGLCHKSKLKIELETNLPIELKKDIALHEVMHAIDWQMCTKLTEEQNTALATGLMQVFIDNPEFAQFILENASDSTRRSTRKSSAA